MKKFTLADLAKQINAQLHGDEGYWITNVNTLEEASPEDASFLANTTYREAMKKSSAGVICIDPSIEKIPGKNYLISKDPSEAFQKIAELLSPHKGKKSVFEGIHPSAIIDKSVKIGKNVTIGPNCVIDHGVVIGDNTYLAPLVSIGFETVIGKDCILHSNSVIREKCELGNRVILQPGCVIGSCGFGYLPNNKGEFIKIDQIGTVILEDDVEIGANTTIDRARFKHTIIRKGTKIDNLVQIAHNVEVGPHNVIAAQTGIAGSAKTEAHVMMGGQVGVLGHIVIAKGSMIATRSGVSKSLLTPGKYRGSPAIPVEKYNEQTVYSRKIKQYVEEIRKLKSRVEELEKQVLVLDQQRL